MAGGRADAVEPRASVEVARCDEAGAAELLRVEAVRGAARRVLTQGQRARQRFGVVRVAEAGRAFARPEHEIAGAQALARVQSMRVAGLVADRHLGAGVGEHACGGGDRVGVDARVVFGGAEQHRHARVRECDRGTERVGAEQRARERDHRRERLLAADRELERQAGALREAEHVHARREGLLDRPRARGLDAAKRGLDRVRGLAASRAIRGLVPEVAVGLRRDDGHVRCIAEDLARQLQHRVGRRATAVDRDDDVGRAREVAEHRERRIRSDRDALHVDRRAPPEHRTVQPRHVAERLADGLLGRVRIHAEIEQRRGGLDEPQRVEQRRGGIGFRQIHGAHRVRQQQRVQGRVR